MSWSCHFRTRVSGVWGHWWPQYCCCSPCFLEYPNLAVSNCRSWLATKPQIQPEKPKKTLGGKRRPLANWALESWLWGSSWAANPDKTTGNHSSCAGWCRKPPRGAGKQRSEIRGHFQVSRPLPVAFIQSFSARYLLFWNVFAAVCLQFLSSCFNHLGLHLREGEGRWRRHGH